MCVGRKAAGEGDIANVLRPILFLQEALRANRCNVMSRTIFNLSYFGKGDRIGGPGSTFEEKEQGFALLYSSVRN